MSPDESDKSEHRQPGPGSTAQGGPRSVGDQGGTGGSNPQKTKRERKEKSSGEKGDEPPSPDQPYPGLQSGSGAARSQ
jgi:hypothetical protein